jgi:hypothetical protein
MLSSAFSCAEKQQSRQNFGSEDVMDASVVGALAA